MTIKPHSKRVLQIAGAFLAAGVYLSTITFSLRGEHAGRLRALEQSDQVVAGAARELALLRDREVRIAAEASIFAWAAHLSNSIPRPYLVDTPLKLSRTMRHHGSRDVQVQLAVLLPFTPLPGYAIAKWEIHLANARVIPFGQALAALENAIPLGKLTSLAIERRGATGEAQIALEFDTLVQP